MLLLVFAPASRIRAISPLLYRFFFLGLSSLMERSYDPCRTSVERQVIVVAAHTYRFKASISSPSLQSEYMERTSTAVNTAALLDRYV